MWPSGTKRIVDMRNLSGPSGEYISNKRWKETQLAGEMRAKAELEERAAAARAATTLARALELRGPRWMELQREKEARPREEQIMKELRASCIARWRLKVASDLNELKLGIPEDLIQLILDLGADVVE